MCLYLHTDAVIKNLSLSYLEIREEEFKGQCSIQNLNL